MRTIAVISSLLAAFGLAAGAQTTPLVIAWQAPDCTVVTASDCSNFLTNILPNISGIGVTVPWTQIDNCGSGNTHCSGENSSCTGDVYQWCGLDNNLMGYISSGGFAGKRIILIISPENDSNVGHNSWTPKYVFTSLWATSACGAGCAPQDVAVCKSWQGSGAIPVTLSNPWGPGDGAVWNANGCYFFGPDITGCTSSTTNFTGFPIVYEAPILVAYQDLLQALAQHYNVNNTTPGSLGPTIAPYIAYVRAGMAAGGENNPQCTMTGKISAPDWSVSTSVPAGYLIQPLGSISNPNPGNFQYIADSAGTTGAALAPTWCQTPGCYTPPDGSVSRWHNVGALNPSSGSAIWPGPKGQSEAQGYLDNGYLTTWASPSDGTGYIATMVSFLTSLNASFPWTISSHKGPPSNASYAYVDAEATLAANGGVGFGEQALNVGDGPSLAVGTYPTSLNDWVANFQKYPNAPVHHLQLNAPGQGTWWSGYPISSITVAGGGAATLTCSGTGVNCSPFWGQFIFISGNGNPTLNNAWQASACTSCTIDQVQFSVPLVTPGTYSGGSLFSPNFWPMTLPFAVQHGATSTELWECDLDYTYNTTTYPTGMGGCNPQSVGGGLVGPNFDYQHAVANTQNGQPTGTGVHKGVTVGNVTHF